MTSNLLKKWLFHSIHIFWGEGIVKPGLVWYIYIFFFSFVRIEHAQTKSIWQYIVFYKGNFDEKLPSTSCLCNEFIQDITQLIADSDRMYFCLYNSSFLKELDKHLTGADLFKLCDSVNFLNTYQFLPAQFARIVIWSCS